MLPFCPDRKLLRAIPLLCLLLAGKALAAGEELPMAAPHSSTHSIQCVTNVSQFASLSSTDYVVGCNFHLTGVVTLVETNRDLVVLQDVSGAVALNFRPGSSALRVGQSVTLDGTNACPLFSSFPEYPFHPSGREICRAFETASNWGEYNLTRMRGYLHPRVSGNYRFWIASDNSSELWLSTDANPWNARRIAAVPRFGWTAPEQWTVSPSQHSDLIPLKAGETYYVEALQEQTAEAENIAVAWQEPSAGGSPITVIDQRYLTPWQVQNELSESNTKGILREYWTNYLAGDVAGMAGPRHFESALSVENVSVHIQGTGELPKAESLALNQPGSAENNYRWVFVEGLLKFEAHNGELAQMEVLAGHKLIQVRALHWNEDTLKRARQLTNAFVRVEGVCEGIHDSNGAMIPGLIWASAENSISVLHEATNELPSVESDLTPTPGSSSQALQEYFQTQGVITFNDRVFEKDLVFIQGENSVTKVTLENTTLKKQLTVGRSIELGGKLGTGKYIQSITPFFAADMGQQVMPVPVACPAAVPTQSNLEGKWCEIEGVVHSVNTNGTLSLIGKNGLGYIWVGQASVNYLAHCIDTKLRARGVLTLTLLDAPLLLISSRNFIDVEEEAPEHPFEQPRQPIANLLAATSDPWRLQRVRIAGKITYRDSGSFFVQDTTGGIRVQTALNPAMEVGDKIEVVAFPSTTESTRDLTGALMRPAALNENIIARNFELNDALSAQQGGTLVQVSATVLVRKINGANQILDMQEKQRIFTATLLTDHGTLPEIIPGSRVRVTGIRQDPADGALTAGEQSLKAQLLPSVNILLRNAQDVEVLDGPPWWTWKGAGILGGLVLIMLVVALLWTHLLRRRLERQQAEQLAFSRQVLGKLEEERSRIAANLHDSLGQTLMVIKHRVISAADSLGGEPAIQSSMQEISAVTSQALEEVRRITHGLGPHQLDHLGLTRAMRALVDRASENSALIFASRIESIDGLFERDAEIHLYRIVQEAVTNILKHSSATEATVVVKKQPTVVSISIRDNGRGFDPAKSTDQSHDGGYGLSGIAERVRILKGTLTIEPQPGAGTSLTAEIPFHET
jgi:signal transduction histidine kinase